MKKFTIEQVTTKEKISALGSALTFEGMRTDDANLQAICDWLEAHGAAKDCDIKFCCIKGNVMNKLFNLHGSNRYKADCNILSVDSSTINASKVIMARFDVGGRWLDDVIDNNRRRESMKRSLPYSRH